MPEQKMKLLKRDILIRALDINERIDSVIHVQLAEQHTDKLNYFEVLQVSDQVTMIKAGDTILLDHLKHTPPFFWNDVKCAVTSEDDVSAVIDSSAVIG